MIWRKGVMGLGLLALLVGCQGTEPAGEQTATTTEAADDQGDGPKAGDGFGEVGGSAGDVGGQLPDVGDFRDPRFGSSGLNR
jgi:hypothetical protein